MEPSSRRTFSERALRFRRRRGRQMPTTRCTPSTGRSKIRGRALASFQFREFACEFRCIERQVAFGIRSDRFLAFLRQDHAQILPDERIDRLAGKTADVDVEETVERIAAAEYVVTRADHGFAPVAGG